MRQTLAILHDAYRELNAKRLFWFVLAVSGLVVLAFAAIGVNERGVTILWWEFELFGINSTVVPPDRLYKNLFAQFGISIWLTWAATILALVSTAGVIPDFVASGSIELSLSKPIGRARLFLTKYAAGLLFVTLQVTVFTAACFLVMGIRGGAWEPGLFLAVPLVVLLFSYLYAVCALLGLLTRSTIASLLLTLLFWFFVFAVHTTDTVILQGREANAVRLERLPAQIERSEARARDTLRREREAAGQPPAEPTAEELDAASGALAEQRRQLERARTNAPRWQLASRAAVAIKTVLPKTSETVQVLHKTLRSQAEIEDLDEQAAAPAEFSRMAGPFGVDQNVLNARVLKVIEARSPAWVLGTSLAFEVVVLALAVFIFVRRDF